jgi:hypothetical protein
LLPGKIGVREIGEIVPVNGVVLLGPLQAKVRRKRLFGWDPRTLLSRVAELGEVWPYALLTLRPQQSSARWHIRSAFLVRAKDTA